MKDKALYGLEKYGPEFLSIIGSILILIISNKYGLGEVFYRVLDAATVFSSITVGFMGALLGILYSMSNTDLIQGLFEYREDKKLLKSYFFRCIIAGILLAAVSTILYLKNYIHLVLLIVIILLWGFLLVYTFTCTYRILNIMLHIIFVENKNKIERPMPMKQSDEKREELKEKFSSTESQD